MQTELNLLINTELIFNHMIKTDQIGYDIVPVFLFCKYIRNRITPEKIKKYYEQSFHRTITIRKINKYLKFLDDHYYLSRDDFFKDYDLCSESDATRSMIYGYKKTKVYRTRSGKYFHSLKSLQVINVKKKGFNNQYYDQEQRFKFFESAYNTRKGFGNCSIVINMKQIIKFHTTEYNSLFTFINEEIVNHIWKGECITKYDICRVLHLSKYTTDKFSDNKQKVMIMGSSQLEKNDKHYNFENKINITLGCKYTKVNETILKTHGDDRFGPDIRGIEKINETDHRSADKLNQGRISAAKRSSLKNYSRGTCTEWKLRNLIPVLDENAFVNYIKNKIKYPKSIIAFSLSY